MRPKRKASNTENGSSFSGAPHDAGRASSAFDPYPPLRAVGAFFLFSTSASVHWTAGVRAFVRTAIGKPLMAAGQAGSFGDHTMTSSSHASPVRSGSVLHRFLKSEAAGGIVLMVASFAALVIANSPVASSYFHWLHAHTGPTLSDKLGPMTPHLWINDGLMAIFFLLVGLEIKRELVDGRLASWQQRRLPALPALLGMALPAFVYLVFNAADPTAARGWAIPAATDIAFAMGALALLGRHAPLSLKVFLVSVAIIDDMGAVAIIALFYTSSIDETALAAAITLAAVFWALNRAGVRALWPYLLGIGVLWYATLLSGVHATIAGVVGAFLVPYKEGATEEAGSPLLRLEHALAPWVAFAIVPVFGFANAGVSLTQITLSDMMAPLPVGIAAGLFLGKQLGVFGGVLLAVKTGFATKPSGVTWLQIYAVSMLCGIGFTMSFFVSGLAFPESAAYAESAKIGIMAGSLISALLGCAILRFAPRIRERAGEAW